MGKPGRLRSLRAVPIHWLQHLSFAAAVVLVLVVPLVWSFAGDEVFRGPKRLLALACWVTLAAVFALRGLSRTAWRDPWWLAWSGVLAGALLSAPLSGQPLRVVAAAIPLGIIACGWSALRCLTEAQRQRLEGLVVAAGVIEAVLAAMFTVSRWRPEGFELFRHLEGRYAWIGTLGNPADVALLLLLPCLLAAGRALSSPGRRLRWALPAAGMAAVIASTRTLSVAAALIVGLAVLFWRLVPRHSRRTVLAGAAAMVVIAVAASPLRDRIIEVSQQARRDGWDWLGSGRTAGFGAAVGMLATRPLTGVGFGLYEANSYGFQSEATLAARGQVLGLETGFGEAHNDPLQHAAETGVLGLGLAVVGIWMAWRRGKPHKEGLPGTSALVIAAGLVSLAQFPLHQASVVAQWAVLAALALPMRELPPNLPSWRRHAAGALALGLVVVGWFWLWQLRGLSVLVRQAETLDQLLRTGRAAQGQAPVLARAALTNLERASRWAPYHWRAQVLMGDLAMLASDWPRATRHFERALALAERPETHFNLGTVRFVQGEVASGLDHLERAVRLNPAIFANIDNPETARAVRQRLEATGYAALYPWVFEPRE